DAFVILDEAQNSTAEQMKMFLTRLGFGSRMVVTGDTSQVDLPSGTTSGLRVVQGILDGVDDIAFETLTSRDVVRHALVSAIVDAYDLWSASEQAAEPVRRGHGRADRPGGRRGPGGRSS
ncbi:MAG TPA: PhoH family protein, partial [Brevibacterium sp.]|nr:PhoH family protein [Brevibacterium sp.]